MLNQWWFGWLVKNSRMKKWNCQIPPLLLNPRFFWFRFVQLPLIDFWIRVSRQCAYEYLFFFQTQPGGSIRMSSLNADSSAFQRFWTKWLRFVEAQIPWVTNDSEWIGFRLLCRGWRLVKVLSVRCLTDLVQICWSVFCLHFALILPHLQRQYLRENRVDGLFR